MTMTESVGGRGVSHIVYAEMAAAELRAMMARRGINQTELADLVGVNQMYVSRRVKRHNPTPLDVADLSRFAAVLRCSVTDLLPRLDSNQEPSGYPSALVSGWPDLPDAA